MYILLNLVIFYSIEIKHNICIYIYIVPNKCNIIYVRYTVPHLHYPLNIVRNLNRNVQCFMYFKP